MGIIKRQSLKTSLVNYAGVLIGVVFFNFVFPHVLGEEYLGLIGLLQHLSYVLFALPALGLPHALLRYYAQWKDPERVKNFHAFALLCIGAALLLFSLVYIVFRAPVISAYKTRSSLFVPYYALVVPMVIFQTLSQYLEIYSMVKLRVAFPTFLREILTRLLLIAVVYLFVAQILSESTFMYSVVAAYGISFLLLFGYTIHILGFRLGQARAFLQERSSVKPLARYSGGMLLLLLSGNVHNFLDGIILPAYLGLGALGIYLRPLVLGQMIQVPYRAISMISIPIIREAIVDGNLRKVYELNRQIGLNLFLIGTFLFTLLIANTGPIFALLPPAFAAGRDVLLIVAIGRLVDMAFGLNSEILSSSKYYRWIIGLSVLMMVMTLGLNVLLIPCLGMNGAALAVSLSLVVFNVLKSWVIWRKFGFHCFSMHYLTLAVVSGVILVLMAFIPPLEFLSHHTFINACCNAAFRSTIVSLLFLIPVYAVGVSPDLNDFIRLLFSGRLFKGGHRMENL